MFKTALVVSPSLSLGAEQTALVQKFQVCPPTVKGFKVSEDVKSLVIEWSDTLQDELRKTTGMEKVCILPNWGRDIEAFQRVYMMCGEDKEAVRQMATVYWTDPKFEKAERTAGMFAYMAEQVLLHIAKMKRDGAD